MISLKYQYTDKELNEILASIVILIDSREKMNHHILEYLDKKEVPYKVQKLNHGDYGAYIPKNEELGILRDTHIPVYIERKNSIDELASSIKQRTRFENELIRSQESKFMMLVENASGYEDLINGKYRSEYSARALLGSLKTFEARYGFSSVFVSKITAPNYIYYHLYYSVRESLT